MFLGHYAVALGAKKGVPNISLGTLFLAAQFVDLLWPLLLLLGIEHVRIDPGNTVVTPLDFYDYPVTHSLAGALVWSILVGGMFYAIRRSKRGSIALGLLVFSHWVLDFLTHRPDLPLAFGEGPLFGLGLWDSLAATVIVEVGLFLAGTAIYIQTTRALDRIGSVGFWALFGVLAAIYLANLFGPPPPDVKAIAIAGNALWLFVIWGYWIDRHRVAR